MKTTLIGLFAAASVVSALTGVAVAVAPHLHRHRRHQRRRPRTAGGREGQPPRLILIAPCADRQEESTAARARQTHEMNSRSRERWPEMTCSSVVTKLIWLLRSSEALAALIGSAFRVPASASSFVHPLSPNIGDRGRNACDAIPSQAPPLVGNGAPPFCLPKRRKHRMKIMKKTSLRRRPGVALIIPAAWVLSLSLQGCGSVNQAVTQVKSSVETALAPSTGASGAQAPGIQGTELVGVFKRYPLGSPQSRDNYPRAAITIVSATPSILRPGRPTADQCIRFSVRLWTDARTSRAFDGLQMCATDMAQGVPFRSLTYWQRQYVPIETTGAVRTDGPQRPKTNFPTEARVASVWFADQTQAFFFLGNILYQIGYDWDQPGEYRAWFVSAPAP